MFFVVAQAGHAVSLINPSNPPKGTFFTDKPIAEGKHEFDLKGSTSNLPTKSNFKSPKASQTAQLQTTATTNQYLQLDILVPIYINGPEGSIISASDITNLKAEVAKSKDFYWRNSNLKTHLNITYITIDRALDISEFWNLGGNYWLTFWDTDGDGESVDNDLRTRGISNNQYDGIFVFYAWANNQYKAAYGGATYGTDIGFLGNTAYSSVPHSWDPKTYNEYFTHEFHHQLASMFYASGHTEFTNADQPWTRSGDFSSETFLGFDLRNWPIANWFVLNQPWGTIKTATDSDKDGIPDSGNALSLTESSFGSNPLKADTDADGLSDIREAMAGYFGSSKPRTTDTDGDGVKDSTDPFVLYKLQPKITRQMTLLSNQLYVNDLSSFTSSLYSKWSPGSLTFNFRINTYSQIWLKIDANNDGLWHGRDNYEIHISPYSLDQVHIFDASDSFINNPLNINHTPMWDDDPNYIANGGMGRLASESGTIFSSTKAGNGSNITVTIPANANTNFNPTAGAKYGFSVEYGWVDYFNVGSWKEAWHTEKSDLFDLTLQ